MLLPSMVRVVVWVLPGGRVMGVLLVATWVVSRGLLLVV